MKYIINVLRSKYCVFVFLISLIVSYFLIPKQVFYRLYTVLGILFMLFFSLTLTCIVRNVKEKILLARTYKSSVLGIVAVAIGLSALQVCGVGAPVCGAAVGAGVISVLFPTFFSTIVSRYSVFIVLVSIIFQVIALYFMNCFKEVRVI